jgi:DNA polymerase-4
VERCIFHVDLDAFFVSVEQRYDQSLRGKAVVVGGHPESRGVVSAASYEARRYGVHSAMPLVQAKRLCPHAVFVPLHFSRYVEASRQFMQLLASMAPVTEPLGLDEAFLDVSTAVPDYNAARQLAVELKRRVRQHIELVASIGVASCKIVAKVASDHDKPDGLVVVRPGEEASFLAPLSIRKLPGVGKKTEESLNEIGVTTVGELAALPETVLRSRFGRYGVTLQRHARGIDPTPVAPRGEPQSMSRETTFESDTRDSRRLLAMLQSMCEELAQDLRRHSKRARTVTVKLRYEDFLTITRQTSLREESAEPETLFRAAAPLLQALIAVNPRRIRLIGVRVSRLSGPEQQLDMFSPQSARLQKLERAIAEVHSLYGPDSLISLEERGRKSKPASQTT